MKRIKIKSNKIILEYSFVKTNVAYIHLNLYQLEKEKRIRYVNELITRYGNYRNIFYHLLTDHKTFCYSLGYRSTPRSIPPILTEIGIFLYKLDKNIAKDIMFIDKKYKLLLRLPHHPPLPLNLVDIILGFCWGVNRRNILP